MPLTQTEFNDAVTDWFDNSRTEASPGPEGAMSLWDTQDVTSMHYLFFNKPGIATFNVDISNWDVGKVTSFENAFRGAAAFNQDLSSWVTSAVTDMTSMFSGATSFVGTGGLATSSNVWNTDVVTNMSNMFKDAVAFNQDISSWATNSVH